MVSIGIAPLDPVKLCEIAERRRDIGMIFAENFFKNRQRLFVQGFSIRIATLSFIQRSQIVERHRNIGMLRAISLLVYRQCPLVQRFSIGVAPLNLIERGQVAEGWCEGWVSGTERTFFQR